eukprot:5988279-Pyramimonas_sp.AAC.1
MAYNGFHYRLVRKWSAPSSPSSRNSSITMPHNPLSSPVNRPLLPRISFPAGTCNVSGVYIRAVTDPHTDPISRRQKTKPFVNTPNASTYQNGSSSSSAGEVASEELESDLSKRGYR